ncbi:MAG: hypothetical protein ACREM3_15210 [Candidatus Rokuibacteriota bacterium]
MTVKELETALGVSRDVAYALAAQLARQGLAEKVRKRPGAIPSWQLPDNALELVDETMLADATAAVRAAIPGTGGQIHDVEPAATGGRATQRGAAVTEEATELQRARIRLERQRLELDELELRERREALERRRGGAQGGGVDVATVMLLERLNGLERKVDAAAQGAGTSSTLPAGTTAAAIIGAAVPILKPFVESLAAKPPAPDVAALVREAVRELRPAEGSNPTTAAQQVLELVTLLRPLVRGGRDESTWVEVARTVAPHVPTVVAKVVDGIRDVAAARVRVEELRHGATHATADAQRGLAVIQQELEQAAARLDYGSFPVLVERLSALFDGRGREFLGAVQAGAVDEATAFETLAQVGIRLTPPIRQYLGSFVRWLRTPAAPPGAPTPQPSVGAAVASAAAPPSPPMATPKVHVPGPGPSLNGGHSEAGGIVGRCTTCHTEYLYPNEASWAEEGRDPCGADGAGGSCGGRIVRVEVNAAGSPSPLPAPPGPQ